MANEADNATLGLAVDITIGPSTVNDITAETVSIIGKTFEGINAAMRKGLAGMAATVDASTASMQQKLIDQSRIIANTATDVRTMMASGPIPTTNDIEGRLGDFTAKLGQLSIGLANFMSALPSQKITELPNSQLVSLGNNQRAILDLISGLQKAAPVVTNAVSAERKVTSDFDGLTNQVKNLTTGMYELQRVIKDMPVMLAKNALGSALQPLQTATIKYFAPEDELKQVVDRIMTSTSSTVTSAHKAFLTELMNTYGNNIPQVLTKFTDKLAAETFKTLEGFTTCFKTADKLLNTMGTIALAVTPKGDVVAGSNYRLAKYDETALRNRNSDVDTILNAIHKSTDGGNASVTTQEIIARSINAQTQEFTKCLRTELGNMAKELNTTFNTGNYELCKACGGGNKYHGETTVITAAEQKGIDLKGSTMLVGGHFVSCDGCQEAMKKSGVKSAYALQDPYKSLDSDEKWTRQAYAINKMQYEVMNLVKTLEHLAPEKLITLNVNIPLDELARKIEIAKKMVKEQGLVDGVFQVKVDPKSIENIGKQFSETFSNHITLSFGQKLKDIEQTLLGKEIPIKIKGVASNDRIQALVVELPPGVTSTNAVPHITLSAAPGVKPFESNAMLAGPHTFTPIQDYKALPNIRGRAEFIAHAPKPQDIAQFVEINPNEYYGNAQWNPYGPLGPRGGGQSNPTIKLPNGFKIIQENKGERGTIQVPPSQEPEAPKIIVGRQSSSYSLDRLDGTVITLQDLGTGGPLPYISSAQRITTDKKTDRILLDRLLIETNFMLSNTRSFNKLVADQLRASVQNINILAKTYGRGNSRDYVSDAFASENRLVIAEGISIRTEEEMENAGNIDYIADILKQLADRSSTINDLKQQIKTAKPQDIKKLQHEIVAEEKHITSLRVSNPHITDEDIRLDNLIPDIEEQAISNKIIVGSGGKNTGTRNNVDLSLFPNLGTDEELAGTEELGRYRKMIASALRGLKSLKARLYKGKEPIEGLINDFLNQYNLISIGMHHLTKTTDLSPVNPEAFENDIAGMIKDIQGALIGLKDVLTFTKAPLVGFPQIKQQKYYTAAEIRALPQKPIKDVSDLIKQSQLYAKEFNTTAIDNESAVDGSLTHTAILGEGVNKILTYKKKSGLLLGDWHAENTPEGVDNTRLKKLAASRGADYDVRNTYAEYLIELVDILTVQRSNTRVLAHGESDLLGIQENITKLKDSGTATKFKGQLDAALIQLDGLFNSGRIDNTLDELQKFLEAVLPRFYYETIKTKSLGQLRPILSKLMPNIGSLVPHFPTDDNSMALTLKKLLSDFNGASAMFKDPVTGDISSEARAYITGILNTPAYQFAASYNKHKNLPDTAMNEKISLMGKMINLQLNNSDVRNMTDEELSKITSGTEFIKGMLDAAIGIAPIIRNKPTALQNAKDSSLPLKEAIEDIIRQSLIAKDPKELIHNFDKVGLRKLLDKLPKQSTVTGNETEEYVTTLKRDLGDLGLENMQHVLENHVYKFIISYTGSELFNHFKGTETQYINNLNQSLAAKNVAPVASENIIYGRSSRQDNITSAENIHAAEINDYERFRNNLGVKFTPVTIADKEAMRQKAEAMAKATAPDSSDGLYLPKPVIPQAILAFREHQEIVRNNDVDAYQAFYLKFNKGFKDLDAAGISLAKEREANSGLFNASMSIKGGGGEAFISGMLANIGAGSNYVIGSKNNQSENGVSQRTDLEGGIGVRYIAIGKDGKEYNGLVGRPDQILIDVLNRIILLLDTKSWTGGGTVREIANSSKTANQFIAYAGTEFPTAVALNRGDSPIIAEYSTTTKSLKTAILNILQRLGRLDGIEVVDYRIEMLGDFENYVQTALNKEAKKQTAIRKEPVLAETASDFIAFAKRNALEVNTVPLSTTSLTLARELVPALVTTVQDYNSSRITLGHIDTGSAANLLSSLAIRDTVSREDSLKPATQDAILATGKILTTLKKSVPDLTMPELSSGLFGSIAKNVPEDRLLALTASDITASLGNTIEHISNLAEFEPHNLKPFLAENAQSSIVPRSMLDARIAAKRKEQEEIAASVARLNAEIKPTSVVISQPQDTIPPLQPPPAVWPKPLYLTTEEELAAKKAAAENITISSTSDKGKSIPPPHSTGSGVVPPHIPPTGTGGTIPPADGGSSGRSSTDILNTFPNSAIEYRTTAAALNIKEALSGSSLDMLQAKAKAAEDEVNRLITLLASTLNVHLLDDAEKDFAAFSVQVRETEQGLEALKRARREDTGYKYKLAAIDNSIIAPNERIKDLKNQGKSDAGLNQEQKNELQALEDFVAKSAASRESIVSKQEQTKQNIKKLENTFKPEGMSDKEAAISLAEQAETLANATKARVNLTAYTDGTILGSTKGTKSGAEGLVNNEALLAYNVPGTRQLSNLTIQAQTIEALTQKLALADKTIPTSIGSEKFIGTAGKVAEQIALLDKLEQKQKELKSIIATEEAKNPGGHANLNPDLHEQARRKTILEAQTALDINGTMSTDALKIASEELIRLKQLAVDTKKSLAAVLRADHDTSIKENLQAIEDKLTTVRAKIGAGIAKPADFIDQAKLHYERSIVKDSGYSAFFSNYDIQKLENTQRPYLNSRASGLELQATRERERQQNGWYSASVPFNELLNDYSGVLGRSKNLGLPREKSTLAMDAAEQAIKELQGIETKIQDAVARNKPRVAMALEVAWSNKKQVIDKLVTEVKETLDIEFKASLDPVARGKKYQDTKNQLNESLGQQKLGLEADINANLMSPEKHAELKKVNLDIARLNGTGYADALLATMQPGKNPLTGLTANQWLQSQGHGQFAQNTGLSHEALRNAAKPIVQQAAEILAPASQNNLFTLQEKVRQYEMNKKEITGLEATPGLSPEHVNNLKDLKTSNAKLVTDIASGISNVTQEVKDKATHDASQQGTLDRLKQQKETLLQTLEIEKNILNEERAQGGLTEARIARLAEVNMLLAKMGKGNVVDEVIKGMPTRDHALAGSFGLQGAQNMANAVGFEMDLGVKPAALAKSALESLIKEFGSLKTVIDSLANGSGGGLNTMLSALDKNVAETKALEVELAKVKALLVASPNDQNLLNQKNNLDKGIADRLHQAQPLTQSAADEIKKQLEVENSQKEIDDRARKAADAKYRANELRMKELRASGSVGDNTSSAAMEIEKLQQENQKILSAKTKPIDMSGSGAHLAELYGDGKAKGSRGFAEQVMNMGTWWAEWTIGQNAMQAIPNLLSKGIGFAKEFEAVMKNVELITQANVVQFEQLTGTIKELSNTRIFNPKELAEGLVILGQAGFNASESMKLLPSITNLATATLTNLKVAADITTTAIEAFNIPVEKSGELSNTLAAITIESKLELTSLGTTFNYIAESAAAAGLSMEQTGTAMGVMSNAGVRASTIGTSLRSILGTLMAPTDKFKGELGKIGLSVEDVNPRYRELGAILTELHDKGFSVQEAFAGLDKRIAGAITSLINNADEYHDFIGKITGTNRAGTMAEGQMDTFDAQTKRLGNEGQLLGAELFTPALMPAKELTSAMANVLHVLNSVVGAVPESVRGFIGLAASMTLAISAAKMLGGGLLMIGGVGPKQDFAKNLAEAVKSQAIADAAVTTARALPASPAATNMLTVKQTEALLAAERTATAKAALAASLVPGFRQQGASDAAKNMGNIFMNNEAGKAQLAAASPVRRQFLEMLQGLINPVTLAWGAGISAALLAGWLVVQQMSGKASEKAAIFKAAESETTYQELKTASKVLTTSDYHSVLYKETEADLAKNYSITSTAQLKRIMALQEVQAYNDNLAALKERGSTPVNTYQDWVTSKANKPKQERIAADERMSYLKAKNLWYSGTSDEVEAALKEAFPDNENSMQKNANTMVRTSREEALNAPDILRNQIREAKNEVKRLQREAEIDPEKAKKDLEDRLAYYNSQHPGEAVDNFHSIGRLNEKNLVHAIDNQIGFGTKELTDFNSPFNLFNKDKIGGYNLAMKQLRDPNYKAEAGEKLYSTEELDRIKRSQNITPEGQLAFAAKVREGKMSMPELEKEMLVSLPGDVIKGLSKQAGRGSALLMYQTTLANMDKGLTSADMGLFGFKNQDEFAKLITPKDATKEDKQRLQEEASSKYLYLKGLDTGFMPAGAQLQAVKEMKEALAARKEIEDRKPTTDAGKDIRRAELEENDAILKRLAISGAKLLMIKFPDIFANLKGISPGVIQSIEKYINIINSGINRTDMDPTKVIATQLYNATQLGGVAAADIPELGNKIAAINDKYSKQLAETPMAAKPKLNPLWSATPAVTTGLHLQTDETQLMFPFEPETPKIATAKVTTDFTEGLTVRKLNAATARTFGLTPPVTPIELQDPKFALPITDKEKAGAFNKDVAQLANIYKKDSLKSDLAGANVEDPLLKNKMATTWTEAKTGVIEKWIAQSKNDEIRLAIHARWDLEIDETIEATVAAGWARIEPKLQKIKELLQDQLKMKTLQLEMGLDIRKSDINIKAAQDTIDYLKRDAPQPRTQGIFRTGQTTYGEMGNLTDDQQLKYEAASMYYGEYKTAGEQLLAGKKEDNRLRRASDDPVINIATTSDIQKTIDKTAVDIAAMEKSKRDAIAANARLSPEERVAKGLPPSPGKPITEAVDSVAYIGKTGDEFTDYKNFTAKVRTPYIRRGGIDPFQDAKISRDQQLDTAYEVFKTAQEKRTTNLDSIFTGAVQPLATWTQLRGRNDYLGDSRKVNPDTLRQGILDNDYNSSSDIQNSIRLTEASIAEKNRAKQEQIAKNNQLDASERARKALPTQGIVGLTDNEAAYYDTTDLEKQRTRYQQDLDAAKGGTSKELNIQRKRTAIYDTATQDMSYNLGMSDEDRFKIGLGKKDSTVYKSLAETQAARAAYDKLDPNSHEAKLIQGNITDFMGANLTQTQLKGFSRDIAPLNAELETEFQNPASRKNIKRLATALQAVPEGEQYDGTRAYLKAELDKNVLTAKLALTREPTGYVKGQDGIWQKPPVPEIQEITRTVNKQTGTIEFSNMESRPYDINRPLSGYSVNNQGIWTKGPDQRKLDVQDYENLITKLPASQKYGVLDSMTNQAKEDKRIAAGAYTEATDKLNLKRIERDAIPDNTSQASAADQEISVLENARTNAAKLVEISANRESAILDLKKKTVAAAIEEENKYSSAVSTIAQAIVAHAKASAQAVEGLRAEKAGIIERGENRQEAWAKSAGTWVEQTGTQKLQGLTNLKTQYDDAIKGGRVEESKRIATKFESESSKLAADPLLTKDEKLKGAQIDKSFITGGIDNINNLMSKTDSEDSKKRQEMVDALKKARADLKSSLDTASPLYDKMTGEQQLEHKAKLKKYDDTAILATGSTDEILKAAQDKNFGTMLSKDKTDVFGDNVGKFADAVTKFVSAMGDSTKGAPTGTTKDSKSGSGGTEVRYTIGFTPDAAKYIISQGEPDIRNIALDAFGKELTKAS